MKTFTISKNHHYSKVFSKPYFIDKEDKHFGGCISFDESCKYDSDKYPELNILFGVKFGYSKNESAYFAWKYDKYMDQIYIFECINKHGNLIQKQIFTTACNDHHLFFITLHRGSSDAIYNNKFYRWEYNVVFSIDNKEYIPTDNSICSNKLILNTMWPKFGEQLKAPHKMKFILYGRQCRFL